MKIIFTYFLILLIISSALSSECTEKKISDSSAFIDNSGNDEDLSDREVIPNDYDDYSSDSTSDEYRLRVLSSLTDNDCKKLRTIDDKKYQCALSSDKSKCEEIEKESSRLLYLSLSFLIILFIL